jgi:hypothetical protein
MQAIFNLDAKNSIFALGKKKIVKKDFNAEEIRRPLATLAIHINFHANKKVAEF